MGQTILLTGEPQVGKTTLVQRIIGQLDCEISGFFTQEIREENERKGFKVITFDGIETILAHVEIKGSPRVGKYGLDLEALDLIVGESLEKAIQQKKSVFIVDEIGPMELYSERFRTAISRLLREEFVLVGTIVKRGFAFTDKIKSMPNVTVIEVSRDNHEIVLQEVLEFLRRTEACKRKSVDQ